MESVFNNNPNFIPPPQRPILQVPRPPHIVPRPQQIVPEKSQQIARPPTDQQVRPSRIDIERIRVPGELGPLSPEEVDPEILDETAFAQLSMDETFRDAQNFIDPVNQSEHLQSTPLVASRPQRQAKKPDRFDASNVSLENLEPIVEKVLENYFVRSQSNQNRGRQPDKKPSLNSQNSRDKAVTRIEIEVTQL